MVDHALMTCIFIGWCHKIDMYCNMMVRRFLAVCNEFLFNKYTLVVF